MRWWLAYTSGAVGVGLGVVMMKNSFSLLAASLVNIIFIFVSVIVDIALERKEQDND